MLHVAQERGSQFGTRLDEFIRLVRVTHEPGGEARRTVSTDARIVSAVKVLVAIVCIGIIKPFALDGMCSAGVQVSMPDLIGPSRMMRLQRLARIVKYRSEFEDLRSQFPGLIELPAVSFVQPEAPQHGEQAVPVFERFTNRFSALVGLLHRR